jgi:hypothetical protein
MTEKIFVIDKILGFGFIMFKMVNRFAHDFDPDKAINISGESLSLRIGNFSSKQSD